MDPQQPYPNQPQPQNGPQVYGPASLPQPTLPGYQQPQQFRTGPKRSSRKPFIIGGVIAGILLLVVIGVVVALSNGKKPVQQAPQEDTSKPEGPQAATAVDVEQSNNAISQDISSVNDDQDFPTDELDDKSLGL